MLASTSSVMSSNLTGSRMHASTSSTIAVSAAMFSVRTAGRIANSIAAEARDQPALTDPLGQARPELRQQVVSVLMPERVVDVLEVVEVEQQHAERRGRAVRLRDLGRRGR